MGTPKRKDADQSCVRKCKEGDRCEYNVMHFGWLYEWQLCVSGGDNPGHVERKETETSPEVQYNSED